MNKRLKQNKSLPPRWRYKHGAYHYRPKVKLRYLWDGKVEYRLGNTLAEAHRTYASKLEFADGTSTMDKLIDRYLIEVTPTKEPRQKDEVVLLGTLKAIFKNSSVAAINPSHCYRVLDTIAQKRGASTANKHLEKLSHIFTKAIRWGVINEHPMKGKVSKYKIQTKRRYVEDWEIEESLKVAPPLIKAYIELKRLTGLRMSDMLSIRLSDIKEDGLHVKPRKTAHSSGKRLIIKWDDEGVLRQAINSVRTLKRPTGSIWLLCTRYGQPYIKENGTMNAFESIWQRWRKNVLTKTELTDMYSERSLRTKVGSDAESDEAAARILAHSNTETARRNYREKPDIVTPMVRTKCTKHTQNE